MKRAPKVKSTKCGYCERRRRRHLLEWWDVIEEWRCRDADGCLVAAPRLEVREVVVKKSRRPPTRGGG